MGGFGSGGWYRWNKATTIEEVKRIDIRFLKRRGWLTNNPNTWKSGHLTWTCGGRDSGFINFSSYHDRVELNYRYREGGNEWQPVKQTVYLESTPCHYGGSRKWFLCPLCNRRVGVLCGAGKLFLCRHCYQLPYSSQRESGLDRLISQKHKLGYRIFEDYDGDGWRKKKGMHQTTFGRLLKKYWLLEEQIDASIYGRYMIMHNQRLL